MNKLHAMAVFVEIAERGSLTAAATALGKSLPTVVRVLAALEGALGARLFNRTTRRVALTEEGRLYLERCRKILAEIDEAEQALGQNQSEPSGTIAVTAPVRFGEMHVAPAVARFLREYPKIEVRLLLLDRMVDLLDEGVDVAVRIAPLGDSTRIAKPIGEIRQLVCASPALLAQTGVPERPEQLSALPCVHFTGAAPGSVWHFRDGMRRLAVSVNGRLQCNQAGAAVDACVAGLGFGRFLCYQAMPALRRGDLRRVLADFEPEATPLSLVYPHNRMLSTRIRTFVDWMAPAVKASLAG